MPQSQDFPLEFPVAGVDVSTEYGRRPPGTTEEGENVRAFDTFAQRQRGGSRPGLSKLVNEKVNGDNEVQHLNVLVDPTTPALNAEVADGDYPDPSTNNLRTRNFGRLVRRKGSGRQPNRNTPNIAFVQQKRHFPGNVTGTTTFSLNAPPRLNSLIVVMVRTTRNGIASDNASFVTNDNLNAYEQVGGTGYISDVVSTSPGTTNTSLTMWYRIADAGVPDQTIRITASGAIGVNYDISAIEYKNANAENPLNDFEKNSDASLTTSWSAGEVTPNGTDGQMILAFFSKINAGTSATSGYSYRFGTTGNGATESSNNHIQDLVNVSGVIPRNPIVTSNVAREFCSIIAAFTR